MKVDEACEQPRKLGANDFVKKPCFSCKYICDVVLMICTVRTSMFSENEVPSLRVARQNAAAMHLILDKCEKSTAVPSFCQRIIWL